MRVGIFNGKTLGICGDEQVVISTDKDKAGETFGHQRRISSQSRGELNSIIST